MICRFMGGLGYRNVSIWMLLPIEACEWGRLGLRDRRSSARGLALPRLNFITVRERGPKGRENQSLAPRNDLSMESCRAI